MQQAHHTAPAPISFSLFPQHRDVAERVYGVPLAQFARFAAPVYICLQSICHSTKRLQPHAA